ncbi:hypothetical protein LIER_17348 [Lithospermum erythrorhizon]|uniref:Retrovirus-related Pol polyprotein from transposon TNT 1-94-like beta-barrel domain-containing protein n=1 Tax=Lithospermum erythrorhizon TaxID=34254 RepID=A0AAV3QBL8_LITER
MGVTGKGIVKVNLDGISYAIGDVYFVPDLKNNLLSVGQLQEKGLVVMFKDDVCNIYHPKKGIIIQSRMNSNIMFTIKSEIKLGRKFDQNCLQTTSLNLSKLSHQRYGHLSHKGLQTLQTKDMIKECLPSRLKMLHVLNIPQMNSIPTVKSMELEDNSSMLTYHNKMVFHKGKTKLL